jgi:hypothetical protein
MKTKVKELDVDFIGGNSKLTKTEEKPLSDFFMARKISATKQISQIKKRANILEKL